jgi:hypothetical protein
VAQCYQCQCTTQAVLELHGNLTAANITATVDVYDLHAAVTTFIDNVSAPTSTACISSSPTSRILDGRPCILLAHATQQLFSHDCRVPHAQNIWQSDADPPLHTCPVIPCLIRPAAVQPQLYNLTNSQESCLEYGSLAGTAVHSHTSHTQYTAVV